MTAATAEARDLVGPYRLIRAIGAGGSARIDLARIDRAYGFQRHVVIKRPLEHLRGDPGVAAGLQREARIGGKLRHPNLVAVLDAGTHDDYDYLVLEYVHGASLRTLMQTEVGGQVRDVPLPVGLGIVIDIARGIHEAHELADETGAPLGLVHRDVSPNNVLLGLDGAVKLADFGIAKETRVATLSGSMHGTVTYMAPEQCRGHAFDRRADIFSLGVILYELVTQKRLFWADNDVASLHRVLSGQVEPPRAIKSSISPALELIVMTATAHDPDQRFVTMRQFADALEALAAAEGYVIGARQVAHTMEQVVGEKHAPWIAATTIPDISVKGDGSLVDVIAALSTEHEAESLLPTFGPTNDRGREEGEVPAAPAMQRARSKQRPPRRRIAGIVGIALAGAAASIAFMLARGGSKSEPPDVAPSPAAIAAPPSATQSSERQVAPTPTMPTPTMPTPTMPTPTMPTPTPTMPTPTMPTPTIPNPPTPTPTPEVAVSPLHHHRKPRVVAKQPPIVTPPPETAKPAGDKPPAAGSANHPANVEWKPTMLLPTDSGSGKPR